MTRNKLICDLSNIRDEERDGEMVLYNAISDHDAEQRQALAQAETDRMGALTAMAKLSEELSDALERVKVLRCALDNLVQAIDGDILLSENVIDKGHQLENAHKALEKTE